MKAVYVLCSPFPWISGGKLNTHCIAQEVAFFFNFLERWCFILIPFSFTTLVYRPSSLHSETQPQLIYGHSLGVGIMVERIRDRKTWTFFVVCLDDLHLLGFQV